MYPVKADHICTSHVLLIHLFFGGAREGRSIQVSICIKCDMVRVCTRPHLSFAVPTPSMQTSPGRGIASPSPSPLSPTVSLSSGITTPSTMQLGWWPFRVVSCRVVSRRVVSRRVDSFRTVVVVVASYHIKHRNYPQQQRM